MKKGKNIQKEVKVSTDVTRLNSLQARFPEIANEFHPTKNNGITADQISYGSGKKYWFKCKKWGHEYESRINNRTRRGCPVCVIIKNSLLYNFPEIAKELHPTKNSGITADQIAKSSNKKLWWKCFKCGYEWKTAVSNRTDAGGSGCSRCGKVLRVTEKNSLFAISPEIAKELHPTKNSWITADGIANSSNKKLWWLCPSGHEYQSVVANRTGDKTGCPFCSGRQASTTNSLAATLPHIASEWHPTKNNGITPDQVVPGSNKKVWWKCNKGPDHEWHTSVANRSNKTNPTGCPCCSGRKLSVTNSLGAKFPKIAAQFHPTKNGAITPDQVTAGSNKKFWWRCPKGHESHTSVAHRIRPESGCLFCAGQKVLPETSLSSKFPKIAAELHPTKNGDVTAAQIHFGSNKKFSWMCSEGHEWKAVVGHRTRRGDRCPYCSGRQASTTNSLATTFPKIAKEWHPTKNHGFSADQVTAGSGRRVWWICSRGHEWEAVIGGRTSRGTGCPVCQTIQVRFPELANELHPTKNSGITADRISFGTHKKLWWKCPKCEYEYEASVASRTGLGTGCPACAGQVATEKNSLLFNFPELAKELHPIKNNELTADKISFGSNKKLWWKCPMCAYEYELAPNRRTGKGRGCPRCSNRWTVGRIREFIASLLPHLSSFTPAELYSLFQQSGILESTSKRPFARAVATGKFPTTELEKFSKGEPSLADDFLDDSTTTLDSINEDKDENVNVVVDEHAELFTYDLPVVETKDVLNALSSPILSSADEEAIQFFIASGIAKLWKHAYSDTIAAVTQAEESSGEGYASQVRNRFLSEYRAAVDLKIPKGYRFSIDGEVTQPNLMQRHFAALVASQKRVGNWSGGGAGKTLSAILATRIVNSSLTVICCPNSTVEGWQKAIQQSFVGSQVEIRNFSHQWKNKNHRYLVLHYEAFQQPDSAAKVKKFLKSEKIDFIIIDEIHFAKQRQPKNISQRRELIHALISEAEKKNSKLYVVGMSATPVVNNLFEGKSMVEAITGLRHDEFNTHPNISNCMKLHQKLVTVGIRWLPEYDLEYDEHRIPVDCSEFVGALRALSKKSSKHNLLEMEQILTQARLPIIRKNIKPKTVIYTYYIQGIDKILREALTIDGWKVGFFTGDDKSGLDQFLYGDLDVLIATSAISTGVDELQHVCNHYVINVLPWTATEFDQLKHRFYRQGQNQKAITAIIPITHYGEWSWDESKMARLKFKRTIADAAVDGVVPEGHLRSPEQAYKDMMAWLERLETEGPRTIERARIVVPLPETDLHDVQRRLAKYGDFAAMNHRWNISHSNTTNERLRKNPQEWEQYHTLYREHRKDWTVVPYEEMIRWCRKRKGYVIGDFGCGEAKIAEALSEIHTVHSFDHIAINETVTACDMIHTPLEDGCLDVAIFSLSLMMGTNMFDYLSEAWRTLRLDGWLHIIDNTSSFRDLKEFVKNIEGLGFQKVSVQDIWKFTHIQLLKTDRR